MQSNTNEIKTLVLCLSSSLPSSAHLLLCLPIICAIFAVTGYLPHKFSGNGEVPSELPRTCGRIDRVKTLSAVRFRAWILRFNFLHFLIGFYWVKSTYRVLESFTESMCQSSASYRSLGDFIRGPKPNSLLLVG